MNVMPQADADQLLKPYLDRLGTVFRKGEAGWQKFVSTMPLEARDVSQRGQSNVLYDLITKGAEREFANDRPFVRCDRHRGYRRITFGDALVVRIKKFRKNRMYETYGARTQQRLDWDNQMDLGVAGTTNAVAGYHLDELRQQFAGGLWIACRNGRFLEWVIEIPYGAAGTSQVPAPMPYTPTGPKPAIVRSIEPKRSKQVEQ